MFLRNALAKDSKFLFRIFFIEKLYHAYKRNARLCKHTIFYLADCFVLQAVSHLPTSTIPPSAAQTPPLMPSASKGAFCSCRTRHFPLLLNAPGFSPFAKESPGLFDPLFKKPALFFVPSSLKGRGETGGMGKIKKTACKRPALADRPFVFVQLALKLFCLLAVGKRYRLRNDQLLVNVVAL